MEGSRTVAYGHLTTGIANEVTNFTNGRFSPFSISQYIKNFIHVRVPYIENPWIQKFRRFGKILGKKSIKILAKKFGVKN